jgi:hypothetical protein
MATPAVCEACASVCDARCGAERQREAQRLAALALPMVR